MATSPLVSGLSSRSLSGSLSAAKIAAAALSPCRKERRLTTRRQVDSRAPLSMNLVSDEDVLERLLSFIRQAPIFVIKDRNELLCEIRLRHLSFCRRVPAWPIGLAT